MKNIQIAIDGPSSAGKSTIAKIAAEELGFTYIDTGAMYRAIGLKALRKGLDAKKDADIIVTMAQETMIDLEYTPQGQAVLLDGEDVSGLIRTPEVSAMASAVSSILGVRKRLVSMQQALAQTKNIIMDGRDIGTHVLPDAQIKIFLTASLESRAQRRYEELVEKKIPCDYESVKADMEERDRNDSTRAASPLEVAEGAVVVDTSGNSLEKSVALITGIIKERLDV